MFKKKKQEVYCQICGEDLTNTGGMINNSGAILCQSTMGPLLNCIQKYSFQSEEGFFFGNYYSSKKVQKQIRKGRLVNYGPLEKSASEQ